MSKLKDWFSSDENPRENRRGDNSRRDEYGGWDEYDSRAGRNSGRRGWLDTDETYADGYHVSEQYSDGEPVHGQWFDNSPPHRRHDEDEYEEEYYEEDYEEEYEEDYEEDDDGGRTRLFGLIRRDREEMEPSRTDMVLSDSELDAYLAAEEEIEARDYHPLRFRRSGRTGLLGGLMYGVFIISVSIVLACILWMAASDVLALNKPEIEGVVVIPKGFDIDDVAERLKEAGIIEYTSLFKLYSSFSSAEEKIEPGQYELSTKLDYRALVKKMQIGSGAQISTKVVIPEGFTMKQIFERLEEYNICSAEKLTEAARENEFSSYSFLDDLPTGDPNRLEGYLFPDTYDFYEGESAGSVLNKMLLNFHYKLTADMHAQAEGLGITLHEAVIIASMIEAEAATDDERPVIASVIYNRLKSGWLLNIDATIQYILPERKAQLSTEGENADTKIDSPYNTYLYTGLPPGPISNPGLASLRAALSPATSGYYFYALNATTRTHEFFTNSTDFDNFTANQDYSTLG